MSLDYDEEKKKALVALRELCRIGEADFNLRFCQEMEIPLSSFHAVKIAARKALNIDPWVVPTRTSEDSNSVHHKDTHTSQS